MNTFNSKTNESNKFVYQFTDKLNLKNPTWNDAFDLPDESYSVSDIQDSFEYIIKKHETIADNPPVQIYVNKTKSRIVFKIKAGYKLELLTKGTMQLLGSSKMTLTRTKTESLCQD